MQLLHVVNTMRWSSNISVVRFWGILSQNPVSWRILSDMEDFTWQRNRFTAFSPRKPSTASASTQTHSRPNSEKKRCHGFKSPSPLFLRKILIRRSFGRWEVFSCLPAAPQSKKRRRQDLICVRKWEASRIDEEIVPWQVHHAKRFSWPSPFYDVRRMSWWVKKCEASRIDEESRCCQNHFRQICERRFRTPADSHFPE